MPEILLLMLVAAMAAGIGALGGLGGAVLLVPILVIFGWTAGEAAPLGLMTAAAGSLAAGPRQIAERAVNHRIGVATELAATSAAVVGAVLSDRVSDDALVLLLAGAAMIAAVAVAGVRRSGLRNPPLAGYGSEDVGERVGSLAGAYRVNGGVAPYRPRRLRFGLPLMGIAGFVAGATGVGGGFIKTPVSSEVMHLPIKVAAATTTFTIGITASAALAVFAAQGRIDIREGAAVIFGSLAGGLVGAKLQAGLSPVRIRRGLSVVLLTVAIVLMATL